MDFLAKLLHKKPASRESPQPQSGGGSPVAPITGPVPTATATAIVAPFSISSREIHESNVEFTRDLVVKLVENLPTKSVKVEPPVVHIVSEPDGKGSHSPSKSLAVSENSFASASSGNAAEPACLHSEDADRRQGETDTDTTEYESAGDSTVPPSPLGSLAGDYYSQDKNSPSPVEVKLSPCASGEQTIKADDSYLNDAVVQVNNGLNITDLCHAFEGVNLNSSEGADPDPSIVSEIQQSPNFSGLCSSLEGVHVQTPVSTGINGSSDNLDFSLNVSELQSTPSSKEKLPVPLKSPNFVQYCRAIDVRSEEHVPSLPVFDKRTENSCLTVSGNENCAQDSATLENCDTEAKLVVCETEFLAQVSNKTSTPTDEDILATGKETDVKELINSSFDRPFPVSSGVGACVEPENIFERLSDVTPADNGLTVCESKETFDPTANSVFHSSVARSLQGTFEHLSDFSCSSKTETATELLNQAFQVLSDVESENKFHVAESSNTAFDQHAVPCEKSEGISEPLNKTFELLSDVPLDNNLQDTSQSLNKTFELVHETEKPLNKTFELVLGTEKPLNKTFECVAEVSGVDKTEGITEPLNKTFELVSEVSDVDKTEGITDPLNKTFELVSEVSDVDKTEGITEPLNKAFELVSEVSGVDKTEGITEPLNKTFELLPEDTADKTELAPQSLDKTFELLPENSSVDKTEVITQSLNKTFECLPEDTTDKTECAPQSLNETFELTNEDSVRNLFPGKNADVYGVTAVTVGEKVILIKETDLNGNTELQASQNFEVCGSLVEKLVSPLPKSISLSSDHGSECKTKVPSSQSTEQFLHQVPCVGEHENSDASKQNHNLPNVATECDLQSLPVKCEAGDSSKLTELYKICVEQQKTLEQEDQEFVNAESFFANEQEVLRSSEASLCSSVSEADLPKVRCNTLDVNQEVIFEQISVEAKRLSQQFADSASELVTSAYTGESVELSDVADMENANRVEGGNRSMLGCAAAPNRQSPRSVHGNRASSPAKKPATNEGTPKIKQVTVSNTPKEVDYTDVEDPFKPRSRIQNSPPRNKQVEEVPVLNPDVCKEKIVDSPFQNSFSNCNNHSEAGPEIAHVTSAEVFKDPSTFEFLSSIGSHQHTERNARLESLYVKFDPLLGTGASTNSDILLPPGVANGSCTEEDPVSKLGDSFKSLLEEDNTQTPRKGEPLQLAPGRLAAGDASSNGVQVTPSPASLLIDKLISLSPSPIRVPAVPSPPKQQTPSPRRSVDAAVAQQSARKVLSSPAPAAAVTQGLSEMEQQAMLEELLRLKELLGEQDRAHAVEVAQKNQELTNLQSRLLEAEERLTKANKQAAEKSKTTKDMSVILDEYEKTISRLIADKEQEQRAHELQVSAIAKERDVHKGHLDTIEIAFSDLHKKYERSKEIIEGLRKNEEVLRNSLAEYDSSIRSKVQQYEALKKHAVGQLEDANQELDSVRRAHAAETAKLQAMLKKAELKVSSLEEMLEQKIKENQELTHICDELINKEFMAQKQKEINILLSRITELENSVTSLRQQLAQETNKVRNLSEVIDEYEKAVVDLMNEKDRMNEVIDRKLASVTRERDAQLQHLRNQEAMFAEMHRKFEECKQTVNGLRANETALKASLDEHVRAINAKNDQYVQLKNHVIRQLESANKELDAVRLAHAAEIAHLNAQLRRVGVQLRTTEQTLANKEQENRELADMCDQLIAKVGAGAIR